MAFDFGLTCLYFSIQASVPPAISKRLEANLSGHTMLNNNLPSAKASKDVLTTIDSNAPSPSSSSFPSSGNATPISLPLSSSQSYCASPNLFSKRKVKPTYMGAREAIVRTMSEVKAALSANKQSFPRPDSAVNDWRQVISGNDVSTFLFSHFCCDDSTIINHLPTMVFNIFLQSNLLI